MKAAALSNDEAVVIDIPFDDTFVIWASSLVSAELGDRFDLNAALSRGLLPSIYFSDDRPQQG